MFKFGIRKITKQGGSFLISLPMEWMKDIGIGLDAVNIEMDADKSLRIVPAENPAKTAAGTAGFTTA
jgi:antitoxin component of MazEF toxin-antitoxin module